LTKKIYGIYSVYIIFINTNKMLTEKQQYVLDVITKFIWENAKSPTIEELTILLEQKSKRWVVQYLETLEKKWFLTRWRWYRSISLW